MLLVQGHELIVPVWILLAVMLPMMLPVGLSVMLPMVLYVMLPMGLSMRLSVVHLHVVILVRSALVRSAVQIHEFHIHRVGPVGPSATGLAMVGDRLDRASSC